MPNKTHLEILVENHKQFFTEAQTQGNKITELFDNIIVWTIGFATGAVGLIFASLDKLQFLGAKTINITLGILVGSILIGILGRVCYAIAVYFGYQLIQLMNFQIVMLTFPHKNKPLLGTETSEEVYYILLEDFKLDVPGLLEDRKNIPKENLPMFDEYARTFYNSYFEWSKETFKQEMGKISQIMVDTLGLKENYFEKDHGPKKWKGKLLRTSTTVSYLLYILSLLGFGTSILYLFIQFLNTQQ